MVRGTFFHTFATAADGRLSKLKWALHCDRAFSDVVCVIVLYLFPFELYFPSGDSRQLFRLLPFPCKTPDLTLDDVERCRDERLISIRCSELDSYSFAAVPEYPRR